MKRLLLLMSAVATFFLLSACGQSGPLYVPGNPSQMAVPPSQPAADDAEEADEESDDPSGQ